MTAGSPAHGGDRVAEVLHAHGVPCIYTLCGGHISPILSAAKARGIRIVDVRDEATAVFAADAAARLSGLPGVAAVTAGPGITNTITALKNAQLAQSPLLLLGGAAPTALQGRGALQDIAQRPLVEPHVKRFFKIIVPLTMPTIFAAGLLVFMRAFADFGTPLLIGEGYRVFPARCRDEAQKRAPVRLWEHLPQRNPSRR